MNASSDGKRAGTYAELESRVLSAEGIEGMQTLLAHGSQTRTGAHNRERLREAQRSRPAAPSRRAP